MQLADRTFFLSKGSFFVYIIAIRLLLGAVAKRKFWAAPSFCPEAVKRAAEIASVEKSVAPRPEHAPESLL